MNTDTIEAPFEAQLGQTPKLTDWSNEPTLDELKADLEEVQTFHKAHIANLNRWDDFYHAKGQGSSGIPEKVKNRSRVTPRLIKKQAEWRYPALTEPLLSNESLFSVSPVSFEDRKAANQNTLILNNQFETKIDKQAFIDSYIRELVDKGTAILRTSWVYEEKTVKETVPVFGYDDNIDPKMLEEWARLKQENPIEFMELPEDQQESFNISVQNKLPTRAYVKEWEEKEVTKTIKNHPFVEVCDQRNTYIDPTCLGDMDKASFVIYGYETTMSDLKRAGFYKNLDKINVNSTRPAEPTDDSYASTTATNFSFKDTPRKKLFAYEYWGFRDIDGSGITVPIVATWVDNVLIRMNKAPYPDKGLPFVLVKYLPKGNDVYGEPDGELLIENQKIMGAVTRGMIDIMGKSANGQMGIAKNVLDATNRNRFMNNENYEYNPNTDPRRDIYMHTYPEIPQSAAFMLQLMNGDAESLTGVKSFGGGGLTASALGSSTSSSASVRGVLDAASKREMSILRRIVQGLIKVARKFVAMNGEFLSNEEIIRLTNDQFIVIRRDDLAGEFDLKINVSTPESDEAKAQELAFMLQTGAGTMDGGMQKIILSEIARLRKMPDLAKMIESFEPQPNPLDEEERKADIAIKMAQAELYKAQAQEAGAKGMLNSAKVPVEQARADNIQSTADATRIGTANKDSGVDHSRELEKQAFKGMVDAEKANAMHNSRVKQRLLENDLSSKLA